MVTTNRLYVNVTYYCSDDKRQYISESNILLFDEIQQQISENKFTVVMTTKRRYPKVTYYCSHENQQEIYESNILL